MSKEEPMLGVDLANIFDDDDIDNPPQGMTPQKPVTIHTVVPDYVTRDILESRHDFHKVLLSDPISASFFATHTPDASAKLYQNVVPKEKFPRVLYGQFFCRHCNKHFGDWKNSLKMYCGDLQCCNTHFYHEYLCEKPDGRRWYQPPMMCTGFEDPSVNAIILDHYGKPILKSLFYIKEGYPTVRTNMMF